VSSGIALVPEGRRVFPNITVEENLLLGAYHRTDKPGIRQDLEMVYGLFPRLRERMKQPGGTLSGGEQQMLAVGRGIMTRPKLFMLDEPSLGLAPLVVKMIFEIILEVNKQGVTVLLVEQNARKALEISSYSYVLETGVITLEGPGSELLRNGQVRKAYLGD
jgi:branched-chain amino acid transport system ATP-binding protein